LAPAALVLAGILGCSGGGATAATGMAGSTTTSSSTGGSTTTTTFTCVGATDGGPVEPSGFMPTGIPRSLSHDVIPITAAHCATNASCHVTMAQSTQMYDQFVGRIAEECNDLRLMINPGDPEHSYVIHKLTNHNNKLPVCMPQTSMPLTGGPLSAADIQVIYDWICEGAPEN
jgi:hypothetical protein